MGVASAGAGGARERPVPVCPPPSSTTQPSARRVDGEQNNGMMGDSFCNVELFVYSNERWVHSFGLSSENSKRLPNEAARVADTSCKRGLVPSSGIVNVSSRKIFQCGSVGSTTSPYIQKLTVSWRNPLAERPVSRSPQNNKRRRNLSSVDLEPQPHAAVNPLPPKKLFLSDTACPPPVARSLIRTGTREPAKMIK